MLLSLSERGIATSLNSSAQAIWELCDGRQTLDQMSTTLAEEFGFSQEPPQQLSGNTELFALGTLVPSKVSIGNGVIKSYSNIAKPTRKFSTLAVW